MSALTVGTSATKGFAAIGLAASPSLRRRGLPLVEVLVPTAIFRQSLGAEQSAVNRQCALRSRATALLFRSKTGPLALVHERYLATQSRPPRSRRPRRRRLQANDHAFRVRSARARRAAGLELRRDRSFDTPAGQASARPALDRRDDRWHRACPARKPRARVDRRAARLRVRPGQPARDAQEPRLVGDVP